MEQLPSPVTTGAMHTCSLGAPGSPSVIFWALFQEVVLLHVRVVEELTQQFW